MPRAHTFPVANILTTADNSLPVELRVDPCDNPPLRSIQHEWYASRDRRVIEYLAPLLNQHLATLLHRGSHDRVAPGTVDHAEVSLPDGRVVGRLSSHAVPIVTLPVTLTEEMVVIRVT